MLERKLSTGKRRVGERNSLSTARDLKLSSSSSLTLAVDPLLNSLVLRTMRLSLLEGERVTLQLDIRDEELALGFFKMGTFLVLVMGATEVGNEQAIERTDEEECIEVRDSLATSGSEVVLGVELANSLVVREGGVFIRRWRGAWYLASKVE